MPYARGAAKVYPPTAYATDAGSAPVRRWDRVSENEQRGPRRGPRWLPGRARYCARVLSLPSMLARRRRTPIQLRRNHVPGRSIDASTTSRLDVLACTNRPSPM